MSWFARLRNVFRTDAVSDEIDRELSFHLDERADELIASGVPADKARHEARRRFGSYALQADHTRDRDLIQEIRPQQRSFTDLSAWLQTAVTVADRDGTPRRQVAGFLSGNGFDVIGLRPGLGRLLIESDDVRGGSAEGWTVVLSDKFWREQFDDDPRAIGAPLKIFDTTVTIVGVTPAAFHSLWPGVEPIAARGDGCRRC